MEEELEEELNEGRVKWMMLMRCADYNFAKSVFAKGQ
jgi:hypothetical protein